MLLTDRLGPRNTAALAGAVAALGMAAIALAPSPVLLAIAVLFAGMSSTGPASPPLAAAVALRIVPKHQGRANTLINSGSSAGVALSGPIALVYVGAWREAYLLFAAVAACASLWVWLTLPARAPTMDAAEPAITLRVLRRSAARPLLLAAFGTGAASAVYWTFAGEIMVAVGGLPASTTSVAWIVIGLAGFAGGAAGDLVRRYGVSTVHRASLTALAAAVLGVGLLPGSIAGSSTRPLPYLVRPTSCRPGSTSSGAYGCSPIARHSDSGCRSCCSRWGRSWVPPSPVSLSK